MTFQPIRNTGAALLLGIAASACQDLPTASDSRPPAGEQPARWGSSSAPKSASPYMCYLSTRTPDGPNRYAYKHVRIDFPKAFIDDSSATAVLRYVWRDEGEEPVAAANCRVPRTPEAIAFMDRRLGVEGRRRRRATREKDDETVGTLYYQDCYYDSQGRRVCPLEEIIVRPPPYYQAPEPYDPWSHAPCWINCAGGASQGYNDGNGYGWDPGTPPPPEGPCQTGDDFLDEPKTAEGFAQLWQASNVDANLGLRREAYGWIVKTATGFRIDMLGTTSFCGGDLNFPHPPEGPDAIAGFIHTHPYSKGEEILACGANGEVRYTVYEGEPSTIDRNTSVTLGESLGRAKPLAGLILDANAIHVFVGHDASMNLSMNRCGY